ncbi:MAG TPA: hypothetical protein VF932_03620 [Anaerolineae bacterium]
MAVRNRHRKSSDSIALPTLIVAGTATPAAPSAKGGACDLPYFPVQGGATWKYHWSAGSVASDETFTISSVTANGFTRHLTFSNSAGAADEQWTYSAEGITVELISFKP